MMIEPHAIIEALYAISQAGRQIFYMTAQPDEVGKWLEFLREKDDHDYRIIKLNGYQANNSEGIFNAPTSTGWNLSKTYPAPGDSDIDKIQANPKYS